MGVDVKWQLEHYALLDGLEPIDPRRRLNGARKVTVSVGWANQAQDLTFAHAGLNLQEMIFVEHLVDVCHAAQSIKIDHVCLQAKRKTMVFEPGMAICHRVDSTGSTDMGFDAFAGVALANIVDGKGRGAGAEQNERQHNSGLEVQAHGIGEDGGVVRMMARSIRVRPALRSTCRGFLQGHDPATTGRSRKSAPGQAGKLFTNESSEAFVVFVAVSSVGLAEALSRASSGDAIWCGSDTISEAEHAAMKRPGLTRFTYSLADLELDDGAIATVEEHHPGETIWAEAAPRA